MNLIVKFDHDIYCDDIVEMFLNIHLSINYVFHELKCLHDIKILCASTWAYRLPIEYSFLEFWQLVFMDAWMLTLDIFMSWKLDFHHFITIGTLWNNKYLEFHWSFFYICSCFLLKSCMHFMEQIETWLVKIAKILSIFLHDYNKC